LGLPHLLPLALPPPPIMRLLFPLLLLLVGSGFAEPLDSGPTAKGWEGKGDDSEGCLDNGEDNATRICLTRYLVSNMPPWDVENRGTLELGILRTTVELAMEARKSHSWAAGVPWPLFKDWVLPYASVNEARSDWRRLFRSALAPLVVNATGLQEAVQLVNRHAWSAVRPWGRIVFKHQQTPLIYDPMSTIAYGFASCTGISIVLIDALRSVGVPARLAGTPAWNGDVAAGNHNWVEVWLGAESGEDDGWVFMEGAPAGGGSLSNPCSKWFCSAAKMAGTEVFAARFDRRASDTIYPMSWDLDNQHVPGVNRTAYYRKVCGRCGSRRLSVHV